MLIFIQGLLLNAGLLIPIGPQNTQLIRLGLLKRYPLILAAILFIADVIFISFGYFALGLPEKIIFFLKIFSIGFILYLAVMSFRRFFKPSKLDIDLQKNQITLYKVLFIGFALTFLNPLAILDTVVVIGGASHEYQNIDRILFVSGALLTSFIWFFGLALATKQFSFILNNQKVLRTFEFFMGAILLIIGVSQMINIFQSP